MMFQMADRASEEKEGLALGGIVLALLGVVLITFLPHEALAGLFVYNFGIWMWIRAYTSRKVKKMPRWVLKTSVGGNLAISGWLLLLVIVKIFG